MTGSTRKKTDVRSLSLSVRRARHEAALYLSSVKALTARMCSVLASRPIVLYSWHKRSFIRLCAVLVTRPHSAILLRQTRSLKFLLCNGRPLARSMENISAQLWKFSWEKLKYCLAVSISLALLGYSYGTVSHGKLSSGSVLYSIRRSSTVCVP